MLHIVNGDTVADRLRQVIAQGEVMPWREIYVAGPVFKNPVDHHALHARARALEQMMQIPAETYIEQTRSQEERLTKALQQNEEIVLWFEHDLFDQTILWYLLHRLHQAEASLDRLFLLSIHEFPNVEPFFGMGQLSAEQLKTLIGTWRPLQREQLELGSRIWQAFASTRPFELAKLQSEDTSLLPYAKEAIHCHLRRYPSVENGLNIIEQTALQLLADSPHLPHELFRSVTHEQPMYGMGDLEFWHLLQQLQTCSQPLIQFAGKTNVSFPTFTYADPAFQETKLQLTDAGAAVLSGADRIQMCGIDQWLGGVHLLALHGNNDDQTIWRWDDDARQICA